MIRVPVCTILIVHIISLVFLFIDAINGNSSSTFMHPWNMGLTNAFHEYVNSNGIICIWQCKTFYGFSILALI